MASLKRKHVTVVKIQLGDDDSEDSFYSDKSEQEEYK